MSALAQPFAPFAVPTQARRCVRHTNGWNQQRPSRIAGRPIEPPPVRGVHSPSPPLRVCPRPVTVPHAVVSRATSSIDHDRLDASTRPSSYRSPRTHARHTQLATHTRHAHTPRTHARHASRARHARPSQTALDTHGARAQNISPPPRGPPMTKQELIEKVAAHAWTSRRPDQEDRRHARRRRLRRARRLLRQGQGHPPRHAALHLPGLRHVHQEAQERPHRSQSADRRAHRHSAVDDRVVRARAGAQGVPQSRGAEVARLSAPPCRRRRRCSSTRRPSSPTCTSTSAAPSRRTSSGRSRTTPASSCR